MTLTTILYQPSELTAAYIAVVGAAIESHIADTNASRAQNKPPLPVSAKRDGKWNISTVIECAVMWAHEDRAAITSAWWQAAGKAYVVTGAQAHALLSGEAFDLIDALVEDAKNAEAEFTGRDGKQYPVTKSKGRSFVIFAALRWAAERTGS